MASTNLPLYQARLTDRASLQPIQSTLATPITPRSTISVHAMSGKSNSSAGSSSENASPSPGAISYDTRPSMRREHSYTHVFPANPPAATRSKKTTKPSGADAKRSGPNTRTNVQLGHGERARQFYSGLDWLLLEATSLSRDSRSKSPNLNGTPLTEGALQQFNSRGKDSRVATEPSSVESELNS